MWRQRRAADIFSPVCTEEGALLHMDGTGCRVSDDYKVTWHGACWAVPGRSGPQVAEASMEPMDAMLIGWDDEEGGFSRQILAPGTTCTATRRCTTEPCLRQPRGPNGTLILYRITG